jgi:hypothetical protein
MEWRPENNCFTTQFGVPKPYLAFKKTYLAKWDVILFFYYFASTKDKTCTDALLFILFYVVHVCERKWSPVETFFNS